MDNTLHDVVDVIVRQLCEIALAIVIEKHQIADQHRPAEIVYRADFLRVFKKPFIVAHDVKSLAPDLAFHNVDS